MKFNLVIEVDDSDILEAMDLNNCTREEAIQQLTNHFYLGLSCIDAMLFRSMGIDSTNSFVEKL
jgi:hypothetical protein